jgi:hypothetical protein
MICSEKKIPCLTESALLKNAEVVVLEIISNEKK